MQYCLLRKRKPFPQLPSVVLQPSQDAQGVPVHEQFSSVKKEKFINIYIIQSIKLDHLKKESYRGFSKHLLKLFFLPDITNFKYKSSHLTKFNVRKNPCTSSKRLLSVSLRPVQLSRVYFMEFFNHCVSNSNERFTCSLFQTFNT